MKRLLAFLTILSMLYWLVPATSADPTLPAPVAKALQAGITHCIDFIDEEQAERAVQRADLTGDGLEDFVVYVGWTFCDLVPSMLGFREKSVQVFAGDGAGGATPVYSGASIGAELVGKRLDLVIRGADCGDRIPKGDFCVRPLEWNAESKKLEYAPISEVSGVAMDGC